MKKIILLLFLAMTSVPAPCATRNVRDSTDNAKQFASEIVHSINWKQVLSSAGKSIPPFFKNELLMDSDKEKFPSITYQKSKLNFRDENGNHVNVDFRENGTVLLNDQAFEVRPLDSLASELNRVQSTLFKTSSAQGFLNLLIPQAIALEGGGGVVLASYIAATGWNSQQCGNKNLSQEQKRSCPQTTAAMQVSNRPNSKKFFPVDLACPSTEPNGTLDLISKNLDGDTSRTRVIYANYNPVSVELSMGAAGNPLQREMLVKFSDRSDPVDLDLANDLIVKSNALKTNVCEGSASNRQRYYSALAKNKSILINASREQDSDQESGDGHSQQAL